MTSRIELREVRPADLPVLFEHQSDAVANRLAAVPARERAAFDEHWARILSNPRVTVRAVVCDGRVVGNLVCFQRGGVTQVGYWIGREFWGRGIASAALAAFLPLIATRPLYGFVASHNPASMRVLEKCGFVFQREQRGNAHGVEVDERVYILR